MHSKRWIYFHTVIEITWGRSRRSKPRRWRDELGTLLKKWPEIAADKDNWKSKSQAQLHPKKTQI